jgi:hypothetical protein
LGESRIEDRGQMTENEVGIRNVEVGEERNEINE